MQIEGKIGSQDRETDINKPRLKNVVLHINKGVHFNCKKDQLDTKINVTPFH